MVFRGDAAPFVIDISESSICLVSSDEFTVLGREREIEAFVSIRPPALYQGIADQTPDAQGFGHFHQDHRSNLVPLCKEHHREIHEGKIKVKGFVMTSNGLELDFEEQIVQEVKEVIEPEINKIEEKDEEGSSLGGWDDF